MAREGEGDVVLITGKDDTSQFLCCFEFFSIFRLLLAFGCLMLNIKGKRASDEARVVWIEKTWRGFFFRATRERARDSGPRETSFFYKIGFLTLIFERVIASSLASREFPHPKPQQIKRLWMRDDGFGFCFRRHSPPRVYRHTHAAHNFFAENLFNLSIWFFCALHGGLIFHLGRHWISR